MIQNRYILGEILKPVAAAFLSLSLLFLVVQLLKVAEVAVGAGLNLWDVLQLAFLFLPGFSVLIIPVSVLTGVLLGFGRLAADGELTAFSAAGVSSRRLMAMPLLLGLLAGFGSFLVAEFLAPASYGALHGIFVDLSKRHVAASLKPGRFYEEIPGVTLYPHRPGDKPGDWTGFLMYDCREKQSRRILLASSAKIHALQGGNYLELNLQNGEVHMFNGGDRPYMLGKFDKASIGIDIERLVYDRTRFIPPVERLSTDELIASASDQDLSIRERNQRISARHRRFAFPLAALLFAAMGCGLGVTGRIRGRRSTLVVAVLVVTGYYLLMRLGDAVVDQGLMGPAPAAWLPDVLLAGFALILTLRLGRVGR